MPISTNVMTTGAGTSEIATTVATALKTAMALVAAPVDSVAMVNKANPPSQANRVSTVVYRHR